MVTTSVLSGALCGMQTYHGTTATFVVLSDPSEKAVADDGHHATAASPKKLDVVGTSTCVMFHTAKLPLLGVFCCFTI